jgi:hypothetical protein
MTPPVKAIAIEGTGRKQAQVAEENPVLGLFSVLDPSLEPDAT